MFEVNAMLGTDGLKKMTKTAVLAYSLFLTAIPGSLLFAQEPSSPDPAEFSVTPTEQSQPEQTQVEKIKSASTSTAQSGLSPDRTVEVTSAPSTTEQTTGAPETTTQVTSTPKVSGQYKTLPSPTEIDKQDRSGGGMIPKGETLTLSRCIDIALGKNPTIVAAVNTVDVNRSRVGEARANYYPQISALGSYTRSKLQNTSNNQTTASNEYSGGVVLNQTIYDFGKTSSTVNISKFNLDSSRSDLNTTQDSIMLSVKQAYYGVLQTKRNRDVAADIIKQFQLHLDQAKGFYEVGTNAKIDVIKAEVDLSNAKLSLINAENAFKIAWVNLNNAMGVPDAPEYSIEDNLGFVAYAITLEEATSRAFDNRPDLKSIVAKRQAAEENVSLQRSGYLPVLSGSAGYTQIGPGENVPPTQSQNTWNAGVTLTFPIFSGFLTNYQVAEAKSNLYVLRANEESIRQQILLDVRQAYLNLQAAEASISTTDLALKQAKENLDLANGRYAAGVGSPIEVSDAFATYVTAQANHTGSLYNYKTAQASIEKAMGAR
jgi:outer membrane protein